MLRMAAKGLGAAGKFLKGNATTQDLLLRVGMDGLGASFNMAATPGDIGDKLIVGLTDLGMSSVGGLAAGRFAGSNQALGTMLDMAGSYGGAMASMPVAEKVLQAKDKLTGGRGEAPWQKMGREQQEQYASDLEQQILAQYGMLTPEGRMLGVLNNGLA